MPPSGASLNCWAWSVTRVVFYKGSANEWKESLLLLSRVPPVFYKDTYIILLHPKLGISF